MASFQKHLVKLLANKKIESAIDSAYDNVMSLPNKGSTHSTKTSFNAEFLMTFNGPNPGQLFVNCRDKLRLALVIHLDFFNPNSMSSHSNSDSIGLVSLALLNLPIELHYQSKNLYLAIIPGPQEPKDNEINHYFCLIVNESLIGWEHSFYISQTALSLENGRDVEIAIVISLNDMPIARKISGTAGYTFHFICIRCTLLVSTKFMISNATNGFCKIPISSSRKLKNGGMLRLLNDTKKYLKNIMFDGLNFGGFHTGIHCTCLL